MPIFGFPFLLSEKLTCTNLLSTNHMFISFPRTLRGVNFVWFSTFPTVYASFLLFTPVPSKVCCLTYEQLQSLLWYHWYINSYLNLLCSNKRRYILTFGLSFEVYWNNTVRYLPAHWVVLLLYLKCFRAVQNLRELQFGFEWRARAGASV